MLLPPVPFSFVNCVKIDIAATASKHDFYTGPNVAALAHEAGDDAVERRPLIPKTLGARAELLEVLAGLRRRVACAHINRSDLPPRRHAVERASRHLIYAPRVAIEAELHALRRAAADRNVKVHLLRHVGF